MVSSTAKERTHHLDDFAGLLAALQEDGFEVVVIGGCAVGAYARLMGREALSWDLDVLCTVATMNAILVWAPSRGITVAKGPKPRSLPVAVLDWNGLEVNLLTRSHGLPEPAQVARLARLVRLSRHGGLSVLVADPFDLLANKLTLNRPKDRPHIEILRRFVEEEVVHAFRELQEPRERLAPARQLLEATGSRTLPEELAARLIPLARTPADLRFLVNHVALAEQADALLERALGRTDLMTDLARIRGRRRFRPPT